MPMTSAMVPPETPGTRSTVPIVSPRTNSSGSSRALRFLNALSGPEETVSLTRKMLPLRVTLEGGNEAELRNRLREALSESGADEDAFEQLASSLDWRMGRLREDSPVTVRVGMTQSAALFDELPRLHNATDQELEE